MTHLMNRSGIALSTVIAAISVLLSPDASEASALGFRNDTNVAVVIQVTSLVNNVPRRGRAQVLMPGKYYAEVAVGTNKQILIADAKQPTRPLYNGAIGPAANDQFFSIQAEAIQPAADRQGMGRQAAFRLKLVPIEAPPKAPPGAAPPARRLPAAKQPGTPH
jgi:hypothetical protein